MIETQVLKKLFAAFPNGNINYNLEFIADPHHRVNSYFRLVDCETEEDVAAKVLEWLLREAHKSMHFNTDRRNKEVHAYHLQGINTFAVQTSPRTTSRRSIHTWATAAIIRKR